MSKKEQIFLNLIKKIETEYDGERLCTSYFGYLGEIKENSEELKILRSILSYHMKPKNTWDPFAPFLIQDTGRSPIPNDLTDVEIEKLEYSYESIKDAELKARIADVLWLRKRKNVKYAHDAISAYIESAKINRKKSWTYSKDRIERALMLSISLGNGGKDNLKDVLDYIKEILQTPYFEEEAYFSLKLTELLLEVDCDDRIFCILNLEKAVNFFSQKKDIRLLNDYLQALSKWHKKNNENSKAREKMILVAENYVQANDDNISNMERADNLQRAIKIYREIGDAKERIDELHKELILIQKKIPEEMQGFEGVKIDISDSVENSIKHVSAYTKTDALIRFCLLIKPTNIKKAFDYVENQAKQFVSISLFGRVDINKDGKKIGYSEGAIEGGKLPREEALYHQLIDYMKLGWGLSVRGNILPAKNQIMLEHQITEEDIANFVNISPLIRSGHEDFFTQGILFGFQGRWDLAGNILIIQFEDCLRFLLEKRGILTSNLKDDFTQEERGTNLFFKNHSKELEEIFGTDIFYELKALLVKDEKGIGCNLRNLAAHGILTQKAFYSHDIIYFWWLLFRLIVTSSGKLS